MLRNLFGRIAEEKSPLAMLLLLTFFILFTGTLLFSLLLLSGSLLFNTGIKEITENLHASEVRIIRYVQVAQQLSFFLLPSVLFFMIYLKEESEIYLFKHKVRTGEILMVFVLAFMATYITTWSGNINSKLVLPQALSGIEEWMKEKESNAAEITNILTKTPDAYTYFLNLVIMALVPSVCEELIFRGAIQQVFRKMFHSGHLAVWITALIFSTIHLQFYGFLPRLILGLIFGYIFLWTGNIIIPVTAHFFNNAIVITFSFISGWTNATDAMSQDSVMKMTEIPFLQILAGIIVLFYFWMNHRKISGIDTKVSGG